MSVSTPVADHAHRDANGASHVIDRLGGTSWLAEKLGVTPGAVSNYRRNGLAWSRYRDLHALAEAAGLNLSDAAFAPRRKPSAVHKLSLSHTPSPAALEADAAPLARLRRRLYASPILAQAGERLEPNALQPAEPFLKLLGEHMRQTMWVTRDAEGREFCLLADYTIAAALSWMDDGGGQERTCWYDGGRFRQDGADPLNRDDTELGFEHINGRDPLGDELRLLGRVRDLLAHVGLSAWRLLLNDYQLLEALLGALKLPPFWQRQVARALSRNALPRLLERHREPHAPRREPTWPRHAAPLFGFRRPEEIAARAREHAANSLSDPRTRRLLSAYSALNGDFVQTQAALGALAQQCGDKGFARAVRHFVARGEALVKQGVPPEHILFRPRYGAQQNYYTGLAFAITPPANEDILASGGRYDSLLSRLGAPRRVPALGATLRLKALATELAELAELAELV